MFPFRYRGYYYDNDTQLYYLNSRYYDPELGRFLNPDKAENLLITADMPFGANLYAYCANNPVMYTDPDGEFIPFLFLGILFVANGVSVGYSIYEFVTDPNAENAGWLALEFVPVPFIGRIGKVAVKSTDNIADAGKIIGKAGKAVDKAGSAVHAGKSWTSIRTNYWKEQAQLGRFVKGSENFKLTSKGLSPFNAAGQKIVLHHPFGKQGANINNFIEMPMSQHIQFHKTYGYHFKNGGWTKLYGS